MSNPSLKDLPKVALDLKSELEGFNHGCMKKAATAEKNVLPSAEGTTQIFLTSLSQNHCITELFECNSYDSISCNFIDIQSSNINNFVSQNYRL